jgi:predicted permease
VGYGLRRLRSRPLRTVSVVLMLAVGIGASTAVFSVVNNTLLRPMMLDDIQRLVRIDDVVPDGSQTSNVSPLNAETLRQRASTLDPVIVQDYRPFVLTGQGEPERLRGAGVSRGFIRGLGVAPALGRAFTPDEHRVGEAAGVVLVSWSLWQRHWAGRRTILGTTLVLNGSPRAVVGVMPRGFHFPYEADVWVPLDYDPSRAAPHYLLVFGRIAPGQTPGDVQREMDRISTRLRAAAPEANRGVTLRAMPLRDNLVRGYDRTSLALLSVVGFLLLVGAVNVAGLGLAEARARAREMAVRSALGATRHAQMAQLLAEAATLSALGGAVGVVLAVLLRPLLSLLVPPVMSVELAQDDIVFDHRVLAFAVGASVVAALVAGVLPAMRAAVRDPAGTLRAGGWVGRGGRAGSGLLLVGVELALAMVLLTGASSVTAAFVRDRLRPLGYRADRVLTLRASLPEDRYAGEERRTTVVEAIRRRIEALPGVAAAGVQTGNPARGGWVERATRPDRPGSDGAVPTYVRLATPGALESLGVPLLAGRMLDARDEEGAPAVVVSRSLARRLWGDARDGLGRRLLLPAAPADTTEWTVVGVCGDVREEGDVTAALYLPYARHRGRLPAQEIDIFVRVASGSPGAAAPSVRAAVHEVDADLALYGVRPQAEVRTAAQALDRAGATLAAGLVAFGLLLCAIGVFGVASNVAARMRPALGVRKALGAHAIALMKAGMAPTMRAVGGGIAAGVVAAWLANRALAAHVTGLQRPDPWLYGTVAIVLGAVALASALGPLVRAASVDPVRVLRDD